MNFAFLWQFAKAFSAKNLFSSNNILLVGVVCWVVANSQKFSTKFCFQQFAKVFSHVKNTTVVSVFCFVGNSLKA